MLNIIHQIVSEELENIEKEFIKVIEQQGDFSEFTTALEKRLKKVGSRICKTFLEELNKTVKEDPQRKEKWQVERKADKNTLVTVFGEVEYKRTYYVSKDEKEYKYLSDEMVGIKPHQRVETLVESRMIEEAIDVSYQKSAEPYDISKQKVMESIRGLEDIKIEIPEKEEKRVVEYLYIEADEDHVSLQKGGTVSPKLIYIHEGYEQIEGKDSRRRLKNVFYISGIYKGSEEIWNEVYEYISKTYDIEKIKRIYISGDGASWIKSGVEYIEKGVFVLDRYHINKYVLKATGHVPGLKFELWDAINRCDKKAVKNVLKEALSCADSSSRTESILTCKKYLLNSWDGIKIYETDGKNIIGCSAEGHISHVLSARLSSRPLGWSREGADKMARLRAFKWNGGNVYELVLKNKKKERIKLSERYIKEIKKNLKSNIADINVEIPVIRYGKRNASYIAINALRYAW